MNLYRKVVLLIILSVAGVASVGFAFMWSEEIIHYQNRFIRRFPPHVADEFKRVDLNYSSYYFAGASNGIIYLGNSTAPLQVLAFNTNLSKRTMYHIKLREKDLPFRAPQVRVTGDTFFVFEGTVPYIYSGKIKDWTATLKVRGGAYFSQMEPLDTLRLAIRYIGKSGESEVGALNLADTSKVRVEKQFLQKQIDGVFDTDGSLHTTSSLHKIIYTYRYRNQFIVSDPAFTSIVRGNTIDTITRAKILITTVKSRDYSTFSSPPLIVNKTSTVSGKYLFVNSLLPGQFESNDLWKTASIIDVYDITDGSYRSSFPIYHISRKTLKSFMVHEGIVYALIGTKLVGHRLLDEFDQRGATK